MNEDWLHADDARFGEEIGRALRDGPPSSVEARARIMRAVRAEARPLTPRWRRKPWRSPALVLVAAASIAAIVALVRAAGISYVPEPVPGMGGTAPVARGSASETGAAPAVALAREDGIPDDGGATARVQFVIVAPRASRVAVVGSFNDWNPSAAPLAASGGVWSTELELPVGRHDYAFLVDGKWMADPSAPRAPDDELGRGYSVIVVGGAR